MSEDSDAAFDIIAATVPALLEALDALVFAARHFDPPRFMDLLEAIDGRDAALRRAVAQADVAWPEPLRMLQAQLAAASEAALRAFDGLREAPSSPEGVRAGFRALRHLPRAEAALYPLASALPAISRYFLEEPERQDAALLDRFVRADVAREDIGVLHGGGEPGARGAYSMYVPETYDASRVHPLVMALHGGSGNGRAFLWSWLRAARSRGAIVVAPTATGPTWSLADPEPDTANIEAILAHVRRRWNADPSRMLLTGMSDGGTFSLLSGLSDLSPFTHLAPVATGFHPMLLEMVDPTRLAGLPIYLVHGALDWMFDIGRARGVARGLASAAADLTWHEIADLSHTYPRDENSRILAWLGAG